MTGRPKSDPRILLVALLVAAAMTLGVPAAVALAVSGGPAPAVAPSPAPGPWLGVPDRGVEVPRVPVAVPR